MDYSLKYVVRQLGVIKDKEYLGSNNVSIEFFLWHKNSWLVKILTVKDESNNKFNPYKNLIVEYIETNSKLVKKLNLPYRKTKVKGETHKDTDYIKNYNRYAIQLNLGHTEVKAIMRKIIDVWNKECNYQPRSITGYRITGVSENNHGRNLVKINIQKPK